MPQKHSARVLQPDRLRRNMPIHRLQIAYASFQWTVNIEGRRPGGSMHAYDACARDAGGIQTSAVQRPTILGSRKLMSDLIPQDPVLAWRWLVAAVTAARYDAMSASTLGRSRIDAPGSTDALLRSISIVTANAARALPRNWAPMPATIIGIMGSWASGELLATGEAGAQNSRA